VTVRVTDSVNGTDAETIQIAVNEVNIAPVLAALSDRTATVGQQLAFTATATDADLPAQTLTFSLVSGPAGASITTAGAFTWTPTATQSGSTNVITVSVSDGALTDSKSFTVTVAGSAGTGLLGEYYDNMDFTGTKVTRIDPTVNFNWGTGMPDPAIGADTFSVRWTGQIEPLYSETYTFYTTTDDGVRLWVNGQLVINKWVHQSATEWNGTINLPTGQKYDIRMDFFDDQVYARATLSWSSASQTKQIVPSTQLYPGTALPSPWFAQEIGSPALIGNVNYDVATAVFALKGADTDIGGTSDQFQYVNQTASGDCEIVARVDSVQNTNAFARGGVMIRETANANSKFAMVCQRPNNEITFEWRTSTGGTASASAVVGGTTDAKYVRLVRTGNTFTAYYKVNVGDAWTQVGSTQTISMATATRIGLTVTSHDTTALCTATFSSVTAAP
jgi:hypothetical protein